MPDIFSASFKAVSAQALAALGFRMGDKGTQTSRTIMLEELQLLLAAVPGKADWDQYSSAVLEDNCLGKRTAATRTLSLQRSVSFMALSLTSPYSA